MLFVLRTRLRLVGEFDSFERFIVFVSYTPSCVVCRFGILCCVKMEANNDSVCFISYLNREVSVLLLNSDSHVFFRTMQ
jgi:hypothetical protein